MRSHLIEPDSSRWREALSSLPHDLYHLPEYVTFAAHWQEPGTPLAYLAEEGPNRVVIPLIVRQIPGELDDVGSPWFDATGPRGYPGPLVATEQEGDPSGFIHRAMLDLAATLRSRRVVSAFVRLHPVLELPLAPLMASGTLVEHGWSTSVDLTLSRDELWSQTNHGHRSRINKAIRLGYRAQVDESWSRYAEFVDLYRQSMVRLGADPFWRLSDGYFDELRSSLADKLRLMVVERDGQLASAALFTEVNGIVDYHLAGTADAFLRDSPSKLLIDAARWWAKDRGNRCLHLAGSRRPGDSLADFKAGFSPIRHPVRSWRLIADPRAYRRLEERWESVNGETADRPEGFFPSFRKPSLAK